MNLLARFKHHYGMHTPNKSTIRLDEWGKKRATCVVCSGELLAVKR